MTNISGPAIGSNLDLLNVLFLQVEKLRFEADVEVAARVAPTDRLCFRRLMSPGPSPVRRAAHSPDGGKTWSWTSDSGLTSRKGTSRCTGSPAPRTGPSVRGGTTRSGTYPTLSTLRTRTGPTPSSLSSPTDRCVGPRVPERAPNDYSVSFRSSTPVPFRVSALEGVLGRRPGSCVTTDVTCPVPTPGGRSRVGLRTPQDREGCSASARGALARFRCDRR